MRALYITHATVPGADAASRRVAALTAGLAQAGLEVTVLAPGRGSLDGVRRLEIPRLARGAVAIEVAMAARVVAAVSSRELGSSFPVRLFAPSSPPHASSSVRPLRNNPRCRVIIPHLLSRPGWSTSLLGTPFSIGNGGWLSKASVAKRVVFPAASAR